MGCTDSKEDLNSQQIDKWLTENSHLNKKLNKLLLLGPGESGKSTFFKQMKILGGNITEVEKENIKSVIHINIISEIKKLINHAKEMGIRLQDNQDQASFNRILELRNGYESWNGSVADDIDRLWKNKNIKELFEKYKLKIGLLESSFYFFENVLKYKDNFEPDNQDILRARLRTTGIEEAEFNFENLKFLLLDVGGQKSERKKWINCFDGVTSILFVCSIAEYDEKSIDNPEKGRIEESLELFEEIITSPWFDKTHFILFLNKIDIFQEKIKKIDLNVCFEDYHGGCDEENAKKFIEFKFVNNRKKKVNVHFTCAVDTDAVRVIYRKVKEIILGENLRSL